MRFKPDGAEYDASEEVAPGLTLDFDTSGRVIGLEIMGARRFLAEGDSWASEVPADAPARTW